MKYTAVSYFVLVGVQTTLILASQWNAINNSTVGPLFNVMNDTITTMSTENLTTDFLTSEGQNSTTIIPTSKPPKGTPSPPAFDPTSTPVKPTTKSRMLNPTTKPRILSATPEPSSGGNDNVGIIIIVVIIVIALLAALICYIARNKGRRYSVDFSSRPEEAQIPLSTVEPEAPVETVSLNGLQFEGTEGSTQEPQETHEPEVKVEDQVELKAEPEKVTVDASADSAAPPADASEDQPKQEASEDQPKQEASEDQPKQDVSEQSPAAPVEPSGGENTDDEGAASKKESLKESTEANENNSNNTVLPQRGARDGEPFWDMSIESMV